VNNFPTSVTTWPHANVASGEGLACELGLAIREAVTLALREGDAEAEREKVGDAVLEGLGDTLGTSGHSG
jgi:hypothetical protein